MASSAPSSSIKGHGKERLNNYPTFSFTVPLNAIQWPTRGACYTVVSYYFESFFYFSL